LSKDVKSIAVIGPNADTQYNQLGDYTAPQDDKFIITPLEGIQAAVSKNTKVTYVKGCAIRDVTMSNIPAAVEAAKASDVVVLVVGGSSARDFKTKYIATGAATVSNEKDQVLIDMDCGEGYDRSTLDLLGDQEKLMQALIETGKPLVVVYIQGRTLKMNLAAEKANALLTAWYPGGEGGHGIADVLFGDYNPAGRLPVSIPRNEGQLPIYYSKGKQRDYMDGDANALYSFGYGLSYTKFEYSDLQIKPGNGKDVLQTVTCTVKNTGNCDGQEIVQLYIRDMVASVAQAPILLKAFERITLKKGESKTVTFNLGKKELSIYNMNLEEVVEPGEFKVMVGAASNDIRLNGKFEL
jgi:beta-glucosidase